MRVAQGTTEAQSPPAPGGILKTESCGTRCAAEIRWIDCGHRNGGLRLGFRMPAGYEQSMRKGDRRPKETPSRGLLFPASIRRLGHACRKLQSAENTTPP